MDSSGVIEWLLDGDPAIAWQAQRDLAGGDWSATRKRVAAEGWGRRLLDHQDPAGTWGGGLYQPKWTSTTYTLLALRRFGLEPGNDQAIAGCMRLLDDASWIDGGVSYWANHTHPELCVNGMVLSVLSYFEVPDPRVDSIVELLARMPLADGGWNCRHHHGDTHSSFHTTISVLEGLGAWRRRGEDPSVDAAVKRGHEFLLSHHMFRSHRTGEIINPEWTKPHFPPRWHYDVLRGLDYLQEAGAWPDPRAADAVEVLESGRRPDGRWPKGSQYSGPTFFTMEPGRVPGRWNTLRALRVLKWWAS